MRAPLIAAILLVLGAPSGVKAVSLDEACQKFANKLSAAQKSGDAQKAQDIYVKGSKRIAGKFNGATCPTVQPPNP